MAATSSNAIIFKSVHTALLGMTQVVTCEMLKDQVKKTLSTLESLEQNQEYSALQPDVLRALVNMKIQTEMKLGLPPEDLPYVQKNEVTTKRVGAKEPISYEIFEKSGKPYVNEEEKQSWQARVDLIERSLATREVFSLSIIPVDQSEKQTWFQKRADRIYEHPTLTQDNVWEKFFPKHSEPSSQSPVEESLFSQTEGNPPNETVLESPLAQELFETLSSRFENEFSAALNFLDTPEPTVESAQRKHPNYSKAKYRVIISKDKDSPSLPTPVLSGFFAPFPGFSSDITRPQYDPQKLPSTVHVANVFVESDVTQILQGLENDSIRERITSIINAFKEDVHAQGLGLIVLEPSRVQAKPIFFKKVFDF